MLIYVSMVDGSLESGERADVTLPSNALRIDTRLTVGAAENVSFVFDVAVVETGTQGAYLIRPVASESGVDQAFVETTAPPGTPEPVTGPESVTTTRNASGNRSRTPRANSTATATNTS